MTVRSASSAQDDENARVRPWSAILTLLVGALATSLSATLVNIALPSVVGAFAIEQQQAQWLATAFLAVSTLTVLLNGWAVERFGVRSVFCAAMLVFIAGSLIGAASGDFASAVAGRILQGAGAGLIQPLGVLMVYRLFPLGRRGLALGVFSLGLVFAPAIGPFLGGLAVDRLGWRIIFLITLPIAVAALGLGADALPIRPREAPPPSPLDWRGFLLIGSAVLLALCGVSLHRGANPDAALAEAAFLGTGAALAAFVMQETRCKRPLMPPALFRQPGFLIGVMVLAGTGLAIYGSTYLIPLYAQLVQLHSPASAGGIMLPAGIAMLVFFPVAGRLADRWPPQPILIVGAAGFALSMALMSELGPASSATLFAALVMLGRLGVSLVMPAANTAALNTLPPDLLPAGATTATFFSQIGGAFGVTLLASFIDGRRASVYSDMVERLTSAEVAMAVEKLAPALSTASADPDAARLDAQRYVMQRLEAEAFAAAFPQAFTALALLFLLIGVIVLLATRRSGRSP